MAARRIELMVCAGTGCVACGSFGIKDSLEQEIQKRGLENEVSVVTTGCNGFCGRGPLLVVMPDKVFYKSLKPEDIPFLVEEHLLKGRPVQKLMFVPSERKEPIPLISDIPFFKKQVLLVLRNKGIIDPENIWDYIARDGYSALEKTLTQMTPDQVIDEVSKAQLRGRGGAGFPAGTKWRLARRQQNPIKYLIANCDEGDPGAFMDRSLIESDPHSVIEGMTIAGYAFGATKGFLYIRTEYPLAVKRMGIALGQARELGLLGDSILKSGFGFDIEVREGSGAFVCGEASSLIRSIEGAIPEPRQKPPRTAEVGLWGYPTVLNNVETLANVPVIVNRGADWFSRIGTEKSKGTKIFSLVGKINNTGLIEVPMGITLREIIYDIGEGIPGNKKFKAAQTGGPSGGCLPNSMLDLPVDFDSLEEAGSMMGSGGMIIMDEDTCMVDVAKFFIQFTNDESCGKCTTCRDGSGALLEVLTRITKGEGQEGDLEFLEELSLAIGDASLCGLGTSLPNPVLSTLRHFRDEYVAHVQEKRCPGLVCKDLIKYYIQPKKCIGCQLCAKNCPTDAIRGETKYVHIIDEAKCTKCGTCLGICPPKVSAITKVSGEEARNLKVLENPIPVASARKAS